jgi:hypothetical protein
MVFWSVAISCQAVHERRPQRRARGPQDADTQQAAGVDRSACQRALGWHLRSTWTMPAAEARGAEVRAECLGLSDALESKANISKRPHAAAIAAGIQSGRSSRAVLFVPTVTLAKSVA